MAVISSDSVHQFTVHAAPGLYPLQFHQHSGNLVPQGLVDPWVALHHHFPAQEPPGDVVLFRQPRERAQRFLSARPPPGDTRNATVLFLHRFLLSLFFSDMI